MIRHEQITSLDKDYINNIKMVFGENESILEKHTGTSHNALTKGFLNSKIGEIREKLDSKVLDPSNQLKLNYRDPDFEKVIKVLEGLNINNINPIQALVKLNEVIEVIKTIKSK